MRTLKALIATRDAPTIQDGSIPFWRLAGSDLFLLANPEGRVVALDVTEKGLNKTGENYLKTSLPAGRYPPGGIPTDNCIGSPSPDPRWGWSRRQSSGIGGHRLRDRFAGSPSSWVGCGKRIVLLDDIHHRLYFFAGGRGRYRAKDRLRVTFYCLDGK